MLNSRLISARKYRKQTQTELAEKSGLDQSRISAYERGIKNRIPKLSTLEKIASGLDLVLHYVNCEYYFRDPYFDENWPAERIESHDLFNQEQEDSAIYDSLKHGYSDPRLDGFWMEDSDVSDTAFNKRNIDVARINNNVRKLNDPGVAALADHSDLLVLSEKFKN